MLPEKIELAGLVIETNLIKDMIKNHKKIGEAVYHLQQIAMDPDHTPTETRQQAYLHEVVHWILYVMNENELRTNEKFVDTFAHLLYQAMKTGLNQLGQIPSIEEERKEQDVEKL